MLLSTYKNTFNNYFNSNQFQVDFDNSLKIIKKSKRIFFIGNGGSNSICSHMMEDYAKIGRFPTFSFSDAALITCYANDYGYDNAITEWLKIHFTEKDLLVAISSSGNSSNILNAVNYANSVSNKVITLSGFEFNNKLMKIGRDVNFYVPSDSYGIVECYHQVILHMLLDKFSE